MNTTIERLPFCDTEVGLALQAKINEAQVRVTDAENLVRANGANTPMYEHRGDSYSWGDKEWDEKQVLDKLNEEYADAEKAYNKE